MVYVNEWNNLKWALFWQQKQTQGLVEMHGARCGALKLRPPPVGTKGVSPAIWSNCGTPEGGSENSEGSDHRGPMHDQVPSWCSHLRSSARPSSPERHREI